MSGEAQPPNSIPARNLPPSLYPPDQVVSFVMSKWLAVALTGGVLAAAAAAGAIAIFIENEMNTELRAALDVGSGSIKLVVAKVNKKTNTISEIVTTEYIELLLAHDLKKNIDNCLSEAILLQAMAVLRHLLRTCDELKVSRKRIRGISTQVCNIFLLF